jgi:hypothetical protein
MLSTIYWTESVPLSEVQHINLPKSFFFITTFKNDVLTAIGIGSSHLGITIRELKMVSEGFNFSI